MLLIQPHNLIDQYKPKSIKLETNMIKVRSKSMIDTLKDPILQQHLEMLISREETVIKEKIDKNNQKQAKLQSLEQQFIQWADKKEEQIKDKIEKSEKNKEEHIEKIVKKLKQNQKYLSEKLKNYQIKKRASMKQAWKKAEKLNDQIMNYHQSKIITRHSTMKYKTNANQLTNSILLPENQNKFEVSKEFQISKNIKNSSNAYNSSNIYHPSNMFLTNPSTHIIKNTSKEKFMNPSYSGHQNINFQLKIQNQIKEEKQNQEAKLQPFQEKLKQTLLRFHKNLENQETMKIQQLGERLEKIQKSRVNMYLLQSKKIEAFQKKKQNNQKTLQDEGDHHKEKESSKKQVKKTERFYSENHEEKRVKDWSEHTKQKRVESFYAHLEDGNAYLEDQKIKYLKNVLQKQVTKSAIEKKLFIERFQH